MTSPRKRPALALAFVMACSVVFLWTAPGRILFPDDEIVFQTTESLWEHGEFAIAGIAKRTGEPADRPTGTFGWAPGIDGRRYGFFGHGLSIVALPFYGAGKAMVELAPETWRHAVRSDHYVYHPRSQRGDWTRLVVSLTNCIVTPVAAWFLVMWLVEIGFGLRISIVTAFFYAFGTSAWPYAGTFLSEPLSALMLLAAAFFVERYHALRVHQSTARKAAARLWIAGLLVGAAGHVHLLNLVAIPCYLGWVLLPLARQRQLRPQARAWAGAIGAGALMLAVLGWDHMMRFGSAFESGRYDHYGSFTAPWESLAAFFVAPGRSFLLYSPIAMIAVFGWPALVRKSPTVAWFSLAVILTRVLFVATRTDWWGGWAIGPRYLVAVVPFAVVPLAGILDRMASFSKRIRVAIVGGLAASVLISAHLAAHSIFEWMFVLSREGTIEGVDYFTRSHWYPSASPLVGFFRLDRFDMLSLGAVRLAQLGHPGLLGLFLLTLAVGIAAATFLGRTLARAPAE